MLDINVTIEGDKVVIAGLGKLTGELQGAANRGLERSVTGIYGLAYGFLSGAGGADKNKRNDYTGFTKKSGEGVMFRSYEGAGGYPVPVRTGDLRRHLDWLKPGESKTGPAGTFAAGQNEAVIYNSEEYANVIHGGYGSSAKFGPRPFLTDALEKFNVGDRIRKNIEEEVAEEIRKAGLK